MKKENKSNDNCCLKCGSILFKNKTWSEDGKLIKSKGTNCCSNTDCMEAYLASEKIMENKDGK